jgi:hypothetical protein
VAMPFAVFPVASVAVANFIHHSAFTVTYAVFQLAFVGAI